MIIYVETAKKILDRMFPHEDEMELEYQFLAVKSFAVSKKLVGSRSRDSG